MKSCYSCNGEPQRAASSRKEPNLRYDSYNTQLTDDAGTDQTLIERESLGKKISVVTIGEVVFYDNDPCRKHNIAGRSTTIPELIVDINSSFQNACIPCNVFVWYSKLHRVLPNCCDVGKCVGWVINFVRPRKHGCQREELCGTIWSLIILTEGQLLLRSVPCAGEQEEDGSGKCDDCGDGACRQKTFDTFEIHKTCCPHYDCEKKLITHFVNGQLDVIGACQGFRFVVGCGYVRGTFGFDDHFKKDKFWKNLICCSHHKGGEDHKKCESFPISLTYEICIFRDCPEDTD